MFSVISFLALFNKRSGHLNKIKECNTEGDTNKLIVHNEIVLKKEEKITEQSCRNENEVDVNITNLFDQCSQESKNTSLKFDYHDSNDSFARKCIFSLEKNRDNSKVNNPRKILYLTDIFLNHYFTGVKRYNFFIYLS